MINIIRSSIEAVVAFWRGYHASAHGEADIQLAVSRAYDIYIF